MVTVPAVLDTHIRVPSAAIPHEVLDELKVALSFPNRERESAKKEKRYGWQNMPLRIDLWREDGGVLVVPRGFRWQMEQGLRDFGIALDWDDRRTGDRIFHLPPQFERYRDHQPPAVDAILGAEDGIYQAPPGSGKTVTVLDVVRRCGMARCMVIVNTIEIADQWKERAEQFLGSSFPCGIIGDGEWDEQRLTIATQQTLYARRHDLDRDGWWRQWGLACLDECHHQTAQTFQEVMGRFSGRYRFGVSATPDKTGDFEYALAVLGDVVHETTRAQLRESGILIPVTIRVVETGFEFPFHSTFTANAFTPCGVEGCTRSGKKKHLHRNNYSSMLKALREDASRNRGIVAGVLDEQGNRQLIWSPQKGHLEILAKLAKREGLADPIYMMTGAESRKERKLVVEGLAAEPSVVFSTIAAEALDVPQLNRGHVVWPTKNEGLIRQIIGRFERFLPDKPDAVIRYHADLNVPVFAKQFSTIRWGVFAPDLMKVEYEGDGPADANTRSP